MYVNMPPSGVAYAPIAAGITNFNAPADSYYQTLAQLNDYWAARRQPPQASPYAAPPARKPTSDPPVMPRQPAQPPQQQYAQPPAQGRTPRVVNGRTTVGSPYAAPPAAPAPVPQPVQQYAQPYQVSRTPPSQVNGSGQARGMLMGRAMQVAQSRVGGGNMADYERGQVVMPQSFANPYAMPPQQAAPYGRPPVANYGRNPYLVGY
jgi:hypothetical protein